jgi:hypothetical protein
VRLVGYLKRNDSYFCICCARLVSVECIESCDISVTSDTREILEIFLKKDSHARTEAISDLCNNKTHGAFMDLIFCRFFLFVCNIFVLASY